MRSRASGILVDVRNWRPFWVNSAMKGNPMSNETETTRQAQGYFKLADMRFKAGLDKTSNTDAYRYEVSMGLLNLSTATRLYSEAMFSRIERLHQKIDRIQK